MTLPLAVIREIVESTKFPGWEIALSCDGPALYLRVQCVGLCNVTGSPMKWKGRKWFLSKHMVPSEIVQTAFLAVMTAMEHEVREQFTYKGVAVMQPHRDLHMVIRMSREVSERRADQKLAESAPHPCDIKQRLILTADELRALGEMM